MNLLADENIEQPLVDFLRGGGNDVLYVVEVLASTPDVDLLDVANREGRVIVTSDLDFGELVFHRKLATKGVLLIRFGSASLDEKVSLLQKF